MDPEPTASTGLDTDEVADVTGGSPTPASCLLDPEPGEERLRFQCGGEFSAVLSIVVDGAQREFPISKFFGQGVEGDSYEAPRVMACCTEYEDPPCSQPHTRACHYDFVEQACASVVHLLRNTADDLTAANSGLSAAQVPAAKNQIRQLANWLAVHQQECFDHFVIEAGIQAPYGCTADNNSTVDYSGLLTGTTWVLPKEAETALIKNPSLTLSNLIINLLHPLDNVEIEPCASMDDNNDVFLEAPPPPPTGDTLAPLPTGNPTSSAVLPQ